MCLITNQSLSEVLKEDMIAYKLLFPSRWVSSNARSPLGNKTYILGDTYKEAIVKFDSKNWNCFDEEDFDVVAKIRDEDLKNYRQFWSGFHSAENRDRLERTRRSHHGRGIFADCEVYKCLIPKGSEMYRGLTGLLVSDTIVIKKRL